MLKSSLVIPYALRLKSFLPRAIGSVSLLYLLSSCSLPAPSMDVAPPSLLPDTEESTTFSVETFPVDSNALLNQINHIYTLSSKQLTQEIESLSTNPAPTSQIKLAVALSRTGRVLDAKQALDILNVLSQHPTDVNFKYQHWILLLKPAIAEQYRLRLQITQQAQQLRESEQKIADLNNKINALKAIEESLNQR